MKLIDSLQSSFNYGTHVVDQKVKQVVSNPSATKKVLKIAINSFTALDLFYQRATPVRPIVNAMKGATEIIDFNSTFKDVMYSINPFSKESIDEKVLLKSLKTVLTAPYKNAKKSQVQEKLADQIFKEIMRQNRQFYSRGEVLEAVKVSLSKNGYTPQKAQQIAELITVQQKQRPLAEVISKACFTITHVGSNLKTLKKWDILDISLVASQIGKQSKVFAFVIKVGADLVLDVVGTVGGVLIFGESLQRLIKNSVKHSQLTDTQEKGMVYKELRSAMIDTFDSGVDLIASTAPLLLTLNPAVIVTLSLVSTGTGLVCFFIR